MKGSVKSIGQKLSRINVFNNSKNFQKDNVGRVLVTIFILFNHFQESCRDNFID